MEEYLKQLRLVVAVNLYLPALVMALSLPDVCSALESRDGRTIGSAYKAWFDEYVAPRYVVSIQGDKEVRLSGHHAYSFRCALLHQGRTSHPKGYPRILFVEPPRASPVLHNNLINGALNIDVRIFCEDVCSGVELWLSRVRGTLHFEKNSQEMVKRYPQGLPPYIVGIPVVG